jgi:hypothetical protein
MFCNKVQSFIVEVMPLIIFTMACILSSFRHTFIYTVIIMQLKQKIYNHYLQLINEKVAALQKVLADLKESGSNETKSTAGDKHETALAMLQIEQANTRAQLQEAMEQKAMIEKINPSITPVSIVNGSLIKTNKGYLFLAAALGKAMIDGNTVMALSAQSPLGKKLFGLAVGDIAEVNNNRYVIESIL